MPTDRHMRDSVAACLETISTWQLSRTLRTSDGGRADRHSTPVYSWLVSQVSQVRTGIVLLTGCERCIRFGPEGAS